jgi:hypothetical protein
MVISAERTAAGLHTGCALWSSVASPLTCGHDMDVLEMLLFPTHKVSAAEKNWVRTILAKTWCGLFV